MNTGYALPDKGDRIEQRRTGVTRAGTVWYADQLQVLVKWDDGRTSSLRVGRDEYVLCEPARLTKLDPVYAGTS